MEQKEKIHALDACTIYKKRTKIYAIISGILFVIFVISAFIFCTCVVKEININPKAVLIFIIIWAPLFIFFTRKKDKYKTATKKAREMAGIL